MHYVYIIENPSGHHYTGHTSDLKARLIKHNEGGVPHTSNFRPWTLQTYVAFNTCARALKFERYLKSASGRAFAKRHL